MMKYDAMTVCSEDDVVTTAIGPEGAIRVRVWDDETTGVTLFQVNQTTWCGKGVAESIIAGVLGMPVTVGHRVPNIMT